jgi:hypothetical protein
MSNDSRLSKVILFKLFCFFSYLQHFDEKKKCHAKNVTIKWKGYAKCKQWINTNISILNIYYFFPSYIGPTNSDSYLTNDCQSLLSYEGSLIYNQLDDEEDNFYRLDMDA